MALPLFFGFSRQLARRPGERNSRGGAVVLILSDGIIHTLLGKAVL